MNKFDQAWRTHYELYKEYVKEFNKIPTIYTTYKGFALGTWYFNQLHRFQEGKLQLDRKQLMDAVVFGWEINGKDKLNRQLVLQSNWKENVEDGKHPLDLFMKDETELCHWLKDMIYDCESWLDKWGIYSEIEKVRDCILVMYPNWHRDYITLLLDLYSYGNESYLDIVTRISEECVFSNPKEMQYKVELALKNLKESQQQVIRLRYGIDDGRNKHGPEVSHILNISREWERRLKMSSLDILRNNKEIFSCSNTELDNVFSVRTKSYLINKGIVTIKDAIELKLIEDEKVNKEIQNFIAHLIELQGESLDCVVIEHFQDNVNITTEEIENLPENLKNEKLINMEFPLKGCNALKELGIETFYEFLLYIREQEYGFSLPKSINVITAHEMYCRAEEILGIDMDIKKMKRKKHIISCAELEKIALEELNLSIRTTNALYRAGLDDVMSVVKKLDSDLESFTLIRGLGLKGLSEIITATQKYMQDKPYIDKQSSSSQSFAEPHYLYNDTIKIVSIDQLAEKLQYCILEKRDQIFYIHEKDSLGKFMKLDELCTLIKQK